MNRRTLLICITTLLGAIDAGHALARTSLEGATVTGTLYFPNRSTILGGPTTAVIGPGITFPPGSIEGDSLFQINFTASQMVYQPLQNVTYAATKFNGFVFNFKHAPKFASVTIDPASTFKPKSYKLTRNSLTFDLSGVSVNTNSQLVLDITFSSGIRHPLSPLARALH